MAFNLTPWRHKEKSLARQGGESSDPFTRMQRDMDRIFEEFQRGFSLAQGGDEDLMWMPAVNVSEDDKEIHVTAELPGLEEKDIEISLTNRMLIIKGEKKEEQKEEGRNFYRMERRFGSFQREIELPTEIEADKVEATFNKKGVLNIRLPKTPEARQGVKKIGVKSA